MSLEKEFVHYEFAVKLKELGFDERCFAYYNDDMGVGLFYYFGNNYSYNYNSAFKNNECISAAPLWQQAFDWFREKHGFLCEPKKYVSFYFDIEKIVHNRAETELVEGTISFDSYEESRYACIEKLIEIISCKSEN